MLYIYICIRSELMQGIRSNMLLIMMDQATEHIISQTKNNIQFLNSINLISSEDARQIISKLPGPDRRLEVRQDHSRSPSQVGTNFSSPPPRPGASNYRALWSYNENGQEAKDLTFRVGDVIQVIDQTNSDWWTGRLNGREGVFPSSYVEKVLDAPQPHFQQRPPPPMPPQHGNFPNFPTGPPGPQQPYPQQPQYFGPPPGNMYPPNPMPPQGGPGPYLGGPPPQGPHQGSAVIANTQQPPKKQGLLGGDLGNTLAHSAVGGVGFGAGSAIGGGIIHSLF